MRKLALGALALLLPTTLAGQDCVSWDVVGRSFVDGGGTSSPWEVVDPAVAQRLARSPDPFNAAEAAFAFLGQRDSVRLVYVGTYRCLERAEPGTGGGSLPPSDGHGGFVWDSMVVVPAEVTFDADTVRLYAVGVFDGTYYACGEAGTLVQVEPDPADGDNMVVVPGGLSVELPCTPILWPVVRVP